MSFSSHVFVKIFLGLPEVSYIFGFLLKGGLHVRRYFVVSLARLYRGLCRRFRTCYFFLGRGRLYRFIYQRV